MYHSSLFLVVSAALFAWAKPIVSRDTTTAVVDFSNKTGTPENFASGLLYGVPDAKDQIPVSSRLFYKS